MAAKMLARTASSKLVGVGHKLFTSQARPIIGFQRVCCTEDFVSRDLRARTFHTIGALRVAYFYRVTFDTGDHFGGGTDANVYIKLVGERGITDEIHVPTKKGDLERGMTNSFEITADDVGPLKRVFVRHDNSGLAPAWFLEKITIENHTGEDFVFSCNDWLRVSSAKGKLGLVKSVLEDNVKKALGKEAAARVEADTTFDEYTSMTEDKVHKKLSTVLSEVLGDEDHDEKDYEAVKIDKQIKRNPKPGKGSPESKILVTEGSAVGLAVSSSPQTRKLTQIAKPKKAKKGPDTTTFNRVKEEETPATLQSQPGSKKLLSTQSAHVDPPLLPAVRLLIDTHGLHRELIKPTGPKGRILKGDVLSYLKGSGKVSDATMLAAQDKPFPQPKSTVDKPGATGTGPSFLPVETEIDFQDIPNSGVRKTIASRLTAAKTSIPHAYAGLTCNISKVVDLRRQLKKDGVLLTLNDFVVKAVAMALKNVPDMNSQWTGEAAVAVPNVDVSIAVATDKGLITPIVRDVDQLELTALSKAVQGLAQKAREGKLTPQEYQGGSFTVSNLGMFGLDHFSAIINPPQTCIMAVGGMKLSLSEDGTINSHITVTLSYDGRAHSESVAFNFLQQFKVYLEDPFGYLIS